MSTSRKRPPVSGSESHATTLKSQRGALPEASDAAEAGLLRIFAAGRPRADCIRLGEGAHVLGRTHSLLAQAPDPAMSRRHAALRFCKGRFHITDLASQNGSDLDGKPLAKEITAGPGAVLRMGETLFLLCEDLRPFQQQGIKIEDGYVTGPAMQRLHLQVAHLAAVATTLYVVGESGAGKEAVAHAFHRTGPQHRGPFVAVNCATIAEGVAERLLFGAVRGSYSGASADSEGYLQAAHGGTLFLDEVGDLDLSVQAKLLRVLETHEVTKLGASRSQRVDLHVCCATHMDLRALASAKKFREDLFFRLAVPQVSLPPLRSRREEIPALVCAAVAAASPQLVPAASLIQTCMLRFWPGNVRELLSVLRATAVLARSGGVSVLKAEHLAESAGQKLLPAREKTDGAPLPSASRRSSRTREQVEQAVREHAGNIAAAARALRMHRTQLRRLIVRYGAS